MISSDTAKLPRRSVQSNSQVAFCDSAMARERVVITDAEFAGKRGCRNEAEERIVKTPNPMIKGGDTITFPEC